MVEMTRERKKAKEIVETYFPHEHKTLNWVDFMEEFLIKLKNGEVSPQTDK